MSVTRNVFVFSENPINNVSATFISPNRQYKSLKQYEQDNGIIVEGNNIKNLFIDTYKYSDVVEFRINNPTIHRDAIFKRVNIGLVDEIVSDFTQGSLEASYDIFSGESVPAELRASVKKHMSIFLFTLSEFIDAGYYKFENKRKVEDWCICFSEPIMEYFIHYFEIKTQSPDIGIVDEFLTNPQFRHMITEAMLQVAAHYSINKGTVSPVDLIDKSWDDSAIVKKMCRV